MLAMTMLQSTEGIIRFCGLVLGEIAILVVAAVVLHTVFTLILRRVAAISDNEAVQQRCQSLRKTSRGLLGILTVVISLALLAYNSWLVWQDRDALTHTLELISRVPAATWWSLIFGVLKIAGAALLARFVNGQLRKWMAVAEGKAKAWEGLKANDQSIGTFFTGLTQVSTNVVWMLVLVYAFVQLRLPEQFTSLLYTGINIYLIIAVGLTIVRITAVIVDTLDALSGRLAAEKSWHQYYLKLRPLIPLFRRCLEWVLWIGVATMVLVQLQSETLARYGPQLIQAIGIFFAGRVCIEFGFLFIDRQLAGKTALNETEQRRRDTIKPLIKSMFKFAALFLIFVLMLRALEFDPMPFLAGAGILGVVVGLGAQPLIHDVVSGFFIIFEHIYLVGDFIEGGGAKGEVVAIDFRTTRIRDADGRLHVVRNGDMGQVINYSKEYTFAVVEVPVAYEQALAPMLELLKELGVALHEEQRDVLEPTEVRGVVEFGKSHMLVRTVTKVHPGCHARVAARFRQLIKEALDARGIGMPRKRHEMLLRQTDNYGQISSAADGIPQF